MGLEKLNPQKFHMKGNAGIQIHRALDNLPGCRPKFLEKLPLLINVPITNFIPDLAQ